MPPPTDEEVVALTKKVGRSIRRALERAGKLRDDLDPEPDSLAVEATPWLALDLDGSGAIENGRELLGSARPTRDGHRPIDGFDALAEHDADGDGRITAADPAWDALLLWSDLDRDRASSAWELMPLGHAGITAIELGYTVRRHCDDRGNCGIERSRFSFSTERGATTGAVIDVHIPCD